MKSPNKMIGGIAGSMAGALGGATNLGAQAQQTGALAASPPQQTTNVPPAASSLIDPFSSQAKQASLGMNGTIDMRQNAVNAPALFIKNKDLK